MSQQSPSNNHGKAPATPGPTQSSTLAKYAGTTGATATGVSFKDQVREAGMTDPEVAAELHFGVPLADATPVSDTLIDNEERAELHERVFALEHQLQQENKGLSKKQWICIAGAVSVVVLTIAAVAGVCATGNCGSPAASPVSLLPPTAPTMTTIEAVSVQPSQNPVISTTTTTSMPTTAASFRAVAIATYINSITLTGRRLIYPSDNTGEERALQWLIDDDVGTSETDVLSLRQRYVFATLWFANGPFKAELASTWLSPMDVCNWDSLRNCIGGVVTLVTLGSDGLSGRLPSELGLLTGLTELFLSSNQWTGTIPSELSLLTALEFLYVDNALLRGTIPSELSRLTLLRGLNFLSNRLTGTIPPELSQLSLLQIVSLKNNALVGDMPFCTGTTRPSALSLLEADCNEVDCRCCTLCCPNGGFNSISQAEECDA